jgi:hypothetical protein
MAIKAIVDKDKFEDEVPQQYRDLYTEKNGKMELSGVEGVRTQADIDRVQEGLRKEREEHKSTKGKLAAYGDRKPEDVEAVFARLPELEAAAEGKLDDKKINTIVESRIIAKVAPVQRELDNAKKIIAERETEVKTFKDKERTRTIHDTVREAAGKSQGLVPTALEDILMFADRHFQIDDDGKVVTKDEVGVTPGVAPDVWLTEMQQRKAHWWGSTNGGGAGGNRGGNGNAGVANPYTHAGWNLTEQGKLVRDNPTKAEQLARSAGHQSAVGARKPAPPSK